ncbi:MAG: hypothetical protein Q7S84_03725 [bacterium]|nr:hypothetical protein [bacterium]
MKKKLTLLTVLMLTSVAALSQHDASLYFKETRVNGIHGRFDIIPWYMYGMTPESPILLDVRYNFDAEKAVTGFIGKTFGGDSFTVTGALGYIGGPTYQGISPEIYFWGRSGDFSFITLIQPSFGVAGYQECFYQWGEWLYAVAPHWDLGLSQQVYRDFLPGAETAIDLGLVLKATYGNLYAKVFAYGSPTQTEFVKVYAGIGVTF